MGDRLEKDFYVTFTFSFDLKKNVFSCLNWDSNKEHSYDGNAVYPWSAGLAVAGQNAAAAGLDEHNIRDQG